MLPIKLVLLFSLNLFATEIISIEKIQIAGAHGMEIDHTGQILFSDTFNSLQSSSSFLYSFNGQLKKESFAGNGLSGIEKINDGYLICDLAGSLVYRTDKHFQLKQLWIVEQPWHSKMNADGEIFVITNRGKLESLKPNGTTVEVISNLDFPFDFAFSKSGIWITEQGVGAGQVSFWTRSNQQTFIKSLSSKCDLSNPEGIIYLNGLTWVVDTGNDKLIALDDEGGCTEKLGNLGIPILIRALGAELLIYANNYNGSPSLLRIQP